MKEKEIKIFAPVKGKIIPIEEVPDDVFSQKILGNGIAIKPSEGKIYSPIDGEVVAIADSLHAYGIKAENGLEILVHFGLETVKLNGEGFSPCIKIGDKVKKGDLLSKVDLKFLEKNEISTITPVVISGGSENKNLKFNYGDAQEIKDVIIQISDNNEESTSEQNIVKEKISKKNKKKFNINFDFLQKLGKVLMVVIAVMPAAGLMISLGKLIQMSGADINFIFEIGRAHV